MHHSSLYILDLMLKSRNNTRFVNSGLKCYRRSVLLLQNCYPNSDSETPEEVTLKVLN
jgi:hypothetical protein